MVGASFARTLYGLSPYADSVRTQTAHFVPYTSATVPKRCLLSTHSLRTRGFIRGSIPLSSTIKRLVRRGSGKANGQKPKMYGHANRIDRQDKDSGKLPVLLDYFLKGAYSRRMTTPESTTPARIEAAAKAILNDNPFNDEHGLWDVPSIRSHYISIATAALAAADAVDPCKPRTITTVEELDALPEGSVVLDRNGLSLHKMGPLGMWNASNHTWDVQRDELEADAFPATVLYAPEAEVVA